MSDLEELLERLAATNVDLKSRLDEAMNMKLNLGNSGAITHARLGEIVQNLGHVQTQLGLVSTNVSYGVSAAQTTNSSLDRLVTAQQQSALALNRIADVLEAYTGFHPPKGSR